MVKDICGVCGGNGSSCAGECDGIPYSRYVPSIKEREGKRKRERERWKLNCGYPDTQIRRLRCVQWRQLELYVPVL